MVFWHVLTMSPFLEWLQKYSWFLIILLTIAWVSEASWLLNRSRAQARQLLWILKLALTHRTGQNKVLRHEDYRVRFWYLCRTAENSVPVLKSRNQWYNMECIMSLAYGPIVKAYEEKPHWKYGTLLFPVSGEGWYTVGYRSNLIPG